MEKIKYAIIGFGGIAENRIAKEGFGCDKARFNGIEHGVLIGATDMNQARSTAAAALGLKWYKSIDELLADKEVEAVYIATNNASHAAIAIQCLNAGKHVIVEKPVATTIEDAQAMDDLAKEKNLSIAVDHMMINNAFNKLAKTVYESGKIGTVNDSCFHMEFCFGATPEEAATWRCSKVEEMGGPIGDVASHCTYVAEYIFNSKVAKVRACYLPKVLNIKAEDGAYIKFEMENGMTGSFKVAFSEPRGGLIGTFSNLGYEIYGTEGVLRGYGTMFQISGHEDEPYKIRLELETASGVESFKPSAITNIYQELIDAHAASIQNGTRQDVSGGVHNLKVCAAIHASCQNNGALVEVK